MIARVDPMAYTSDRFGAPTREPGNRWAFWYFKPEPIPRELTLSSATIRAMSDADASLGRLRGVGSLVRDPELLLGPYLTREAVASSRIEGTQASLSDVLKAEASGSGAPTEDVAEVERYIAATRQGYALIETLPLTQRLILQLHATLLDGVRGREKMPGQLRTSPVWVGSTTDGPDTARFVPPLPADLPDLLSDWESFVNTPSEIPTLVRCGLMHYQFETIHPFLDGNGRIGRLLINLLLMEEGRLPTPLLYISGYLERHRQEYYNRLQEVRESGKVQEWLQFFLTAVRRSADDAATRAEKLVEVRERYLAESFRSRSLLPALVDLLFTNPFVTVHRVERQTGLTNQGARNLIREAERRGWVAEIGAVGRGGRMYWVAQELYAIAEEDAAY